MSDVSAPKTLVWDLAQRCMHWLLLLAVVVSWATQELDGDLFTWHVWSGCVVLTLVVTRIVWGFVGTRHARFARFVRGPRAAFAYARGLLRGDAPHFVGHNPLGAWMIVALLALLLAMPLTGLFGNDEISEFGPLYGYVSDSLSNRLTSIHKQIFDYLIVLIGLHVAAALLYLFIRRENLILPMITGRKSAAQVPPEEAIRNTRSWLALLIGAAVAGTIAYVVQSAPPPAPAFYF